MRLMYFQDDNSDIQNKKKAGEGKFLEATNQEPFRNA